MSIPDARKACTFAGWAALISGGLTFLIVTAALMMPGVAELADWADPFIYFDALLLCLLSIAMFRCSRAAAILLLVHRVLNQMVVLSEASGLESARDILTGFALIAVFSYAIYASFKYHQLRRAEDPNYKPVKNVVLVVLASVFGSVVLFIGGGLAIIGTLTTMQIIPETAVVPGDRMTQENMTLLHEYGLIEPDETLQYFYSEGLVSILEDGQFLTNRRAVVYWQEGEDVFYQDIPYDQIRNVEVWYSDNSFDRTMMELYLTESDEPDIFLWASTENGLDSAFVEALMFNWETSQYAGVSAGI